MPERPLPPGEVLFRVAVDTDGYFSEYAITRGRRDGVTFWGWPAYASTGWEVTNEKGPIVFELLRRLEVRESRLLPDRTAPATRHELDGLSESLFAETYAAAQNHETLARVVAKIETRLAMIELERHEERRARLETP